jgi:hypothetical protein
MAPMKHNARLFLALAAIAALFGTAVLFTGCKHKDSEQQGGSATAKKYTCSMHPEYTSDNPGKCPKCGMDLVQK